MKPLTYQAYQQMPNEPYWYYCGIASEEAIKDMRSQVKKYSSTIAESLALHAFEKGTTYPKTINVNSEFDIDYLCEKTAFDTRVRYAKKPHNYLALAHSAWNNERTLRVETQAVANELQFELRSWASMSLWQYIKWWVRRNFPFRRLL
jgi:hypothetical protein